MAAGDFIPKIEYDAGAGTVVIEFDLPPEGYDPRGRRIKAVARVSKSANGAEQTSFNYNEETKNIKFKLITKAIVDLVETFYLDYGSRGGSFKYFEDKDSASFITVTLDKSGRDFRPKGILPDGALDFKYEFRLKLRRVI